MRLWIPACALLLLASAASFAEETIPADGVLWDPPTLHCIGVRWFVNEAEYPLASIAVTYRRVGETNWRRAMPLFRVEPDALLEDRRPPEGTTLYAGSIFNLTPDTDWEVRLSLTDKDGKTAERCATLHTWKEPVAPAPSRTLHVVPGTGGGDGTAANPFKGLAAAEVAAQPGDLILVHAGDYPGPVKFGRSGTEAAPIVWRAAGDGVAAITGPAKGTAASCNGRFVFLEGFTFRKTRTGLRLTAANNVTVRKCKFLEVQTGITASRRQVRLCIVDNVLVGPHTWGVRGDVRGEPRGIQVSGIGHVIAYNRVSGFRDGIDTRPPYPVRGIDIHNNDVSESQDDGAELDASESNCRLYCNRFTNVPMGISFQPSRGGPNYAIRNVLVNVGHETFKLHVTRSKVTSGGVILHNTVVRKGPAFRVWSKSSQAHFFYARNNLYVTTGADQAIEITCPMESADFDYDVFAGGPFRHFAYWNKKRYPTIDAFRNAGQEAHGTVLNGTTGIFASPAMHPPADKSEKMDYAKSDARLAATSPAIDKGEVLPNINDGFKGAAPDAGAIEFGDPLPHYGPRSE